MKLLFDHIPKTGGQSIISVLNEQFACIYPLVGRDNTCADYFKTLPSNARYSYNCIYGHGAHQLIPYVHPETIIATVVRQPVERVISYYRYAKADPGHPCHQQALNQSLIQFVETCPGTETRNHYHYTLGPSASVIRQKYHHIGFTHDITSFMHSLGLKWDDRRLNAIPPEIVLSDDCKRIAELNRLDIKIYNDLRETYNTVPKRVNELLKD